MSEARPHMEHGSGLLNPSPATPDPATAGPAEELTVHFSRAPGKTRQNVEEAVTEEPAAHFEKQGITTERQ